ncbi:MAG: hypothetical protein ACYTHJ_16715 [Planctomycetota bacterium]|jgi:hypothetical protein
MSDEPVYVSPSTVKSLWQEYRIFANRLELDSLFGLISIPFEHIETVDLRESDVGGLLKGDLGLKNFRPAIKLDWANFLEHIVIDKSEGWCRRVLISPDDPAAFNQALNEALETFRG